MGCNVTKEQIMRVMNGESIDSIQKIRLKIDNNSLMNKTISFETEETEKITNWISSKGKTYLSDEEIGNGIDILQDVVTNNHLENLKDKSLKKGDGIFVLSTNEIERITFNEYEMSKIKPYYTTNQLWQYYGDSKNVYWLIYADMDVRSHISRYPNIKVI